jgi:hypothetical protein
MGEREGTQGVEEGYLRAESTVGRSGSCAMAAVVTRRSDPTRSGVVRPLLCVLVTACYSVTPPAHNDRWRRSAPSCGPPQRSATKGNTRRWLEFRGQEEGEEKREDGVGVGGG